MQDRITKASLVRFKKDSVIRKNPHNPAFSICFSGKIQYGLSIKKPSSLKVFYIICRLRSYLSGY